MTWFLLDCGHYALATDGSYTRRRGITPGTVKCRVCSLQLHELTDGAGVLGRIVREVSTNPKDS